MAEEPDCAAGAPKYVQRESRGPKTFVSPLEVRFSQWKVRHTFWNGEPLESVVPLVQILRCSAEEATSYGAKWKIQAPFPIIEIASWRCKLRDPHTGRPIVDPNTGKPLYDPESRWFTLDNRRLYCLQVAAVSVWPDRCIVEVSEVPSEDTKMRELKKLRTVDCGKSLMIGSTADQVPFWEWSWRAEVGVGSDCEDFFGYGGFTPPGSPVATPVAAKVSALFTAAQKAEKVENTAGKAQGKRRNGKKIWKPVANDDDVGTTAGTVKISAQEGAAMGAELLGLIKGNGSNGNHASASSSTWPGGQADSSGQVQGGQVNRGRNRGKGGKGGKGKNKNQHAATSDGWYW